MTLSSLEWDEKSDGSRCESGPRRVILSKVTDLLKHQFPQGGVCVCVCVCVCVLARVGVGVGVGWVGAREVSGSPTS